MKKILSITLALALAFTLASCGNGSSLSDADSASPTSGNDNLPSSGIDVNKNEAETVAPSPKVSDAPSVGNPATPSTDSQSDTRSVVVGLPVLHMPDDTLFHGIWEISIRFTDLWTGSATHTKTDFTDIVIYVDGTANPVSIIDFIIYNKNEVGLIITTESESMTRFAQFPATYQVSLSVHGTEISQDEAYGVVVNSDRTWQWLE